MAIHFVGFRGDEYNRAQLVFGAPDFVHHAWDYRAIAEVCEGDVVLFCLHDEFQRVQKYTRDDSSFF